MASKLGQNLDKVWATVCSLGGSAVSRLVDDPRLFLQSLQTVASKLGQNSGQGLGYSLLLGWFRRLPSLRRSSAIPAVPADCGIKAGPESGQGLGYSLFLGRFCRLPPRRRSPWHQSWARIWTRSGLQSARRAIQPSPASSTIPSYSCSPRRRWRRSWARIWTRSGLLWAILAPPASSTNQIIFRMHSKSWPTKSKCRHGRCSAFTLAVRIAYGASSSMSLSQ